MTRETLTARTLVTAALRIRMGLGCGPGGCAATLYRCPQTVRPQEGGEVLWSCSCL